MLEDASADVKDALVSIVIMYGIGGLAVLASVMVRKNLGRSLTTSIDASADVGQRIRELESLGEMGRLFFNTERSVYLNKRGEVIPIDIVDHTLVHLQWNGCENPSYFPKMIDELASHGRKVGADHFSLSNIANAHRDVLFSVLYHRARSD